MNNPDHISESLETLFWVNILKFYDEDQGWRKKSGSGMEKIRIRDKHPGSATQHARYSTEFDESMAAKSAIIHMNAYPKYCTRLEMEQWCKIFVLKVPKT
jgi:hypothetical protein